MGNGKERIRAFSGSEIIMGSGEFVDREGMKLFQVTPPELSERLGRVNLSRGVLPDPTGIYQLDKATVFFFEEGKGNLLLNNFFQDVEEGDWLFVPPGHSFQILPSMQPLKILFVLPNQTNLEGAFRRVLEHRTEKPKISLFKAPQGE